MKPNILEVSIEKLVMEDLAIEDGERIRASVERELTRLLVEQEVSERLVGNVNIDRIEGGQIAIEPSANRGSADKQIARAIYGVIQR
jgi:hypothetical protein